MFCPNCGSQMEDDAKFCTACGACVEEGEPNKSAGARKKRGGRKSGAFLKAMGGRLLYARVAAAVMVVAVFCYAAIQISGLNYKKPLDQVVKLVNKQDISVGSYIHAAYPKFVDKAFRDSEKLLKDVDGYINFQDSQRESLISAFVTINDQYGDDAKLSYEIVKRKELSQKELNEIRSRYRDLRTRLEQVQKGGRNYYEIENILTSAKLKKYDKMMDELVDNLKEIEVTEGYRLELQVWIKGKENDGGLSSNFNIVKINGKWCIDCTYGGFYFLNPVLKW